MLNSLSKKLFVLSTTTLVLTLFIIISFSKVAFEQKHTKSDLDQVIDLQLCVDFLRSQLWVFIQFGDEPSLVQVERAQAELDTKLTAYKKNTPQLANIQRMNLGLNALLNKEKQVYFLSINGLEDPVWPHDISARGLLHSRYNMIVQNMTEELAYVHQSVLNRNATSLHQVMIFAGTWLVICSVLVSVTAWLISFRFKSGAQAMKNAIMSVAKGKLDSKVQAVKMDSEFSDIARFFNQMTVSLRESTVTKRELEEEVLRQTQQLEHKQKQLIFLSEHEPLTNLYNRRAFDKALENSIVKAKRTQCKLALFFIDLDDFKSINDSFGHDAGDAILIEVSRRISAVTRESDFVGRFGGDEFVICLDLLHNFDIVSKKAEQLLDTINTPIVFNGNTLKVGASIGVSYFPDQTQNKDALLSMADEAMYRAKKMSGSACFDGKTAVCKKGANSVRLTTIND
ncbi:diguanylate cyclase domain-containing protein [Vibrio ostreicida]|uniref:Diguanylate cyclase n=1 Tax=Vibrio ostreicida TaxID=526588 RepID=A0ABT8BY39_9VIBR|nr:diguanylate cyclase [Vibrio ostreicida]MDN3611943.1 diguanylate cyclase [Vibrio ostreicida]NPD08877.1 diguanylate cyclase [Vibrio ostreicida]